MNDLIALVGGTHPTVSSGVKVDAVKLENVGRVKKAVVDARVTTIVGRPDAQDRVAKRVEELRSQLDNVSLSREDVDAVKRRLAKLSSGAAIVRVGGATELELVEKKYRIEDALHAARAALEEGIVPGGGQALLRIKRELEQSDGIAKDIAKGDGYAAGVKAVLEACTAPLRRIVKNAGQSPDVVVSRCQDIVLPNRGWDAVKADIVDLRAAGIIDPVKVTRCALQNAVSVAGIFLQLDAVVHEPKEEKS
jgi:chaperonin GroEL